MFEQVEKEFGAIVTLFLLYSVQGIPLGLMNSVSYTIRQNHVSYAAQGIFSTAMWPFALKILISPFVDRFFVRRFGRRKSWLVPVQFLISCFLLSLAYACSQAQVKPGKSQLSGIDVQMLTISFVFLGVLTAVQDVVVDGWAISLFSKENVALAGTCNTVGNTFGMFFGEVVFVALESPVMANRLFRDVPQVDGILPATTILQIYGLVFIACTTFLIFGIREKNDELIDKHQLPPADSFRMVYRIVKLKQFHMLTKVFLFSQLAFSPATATAALEIIEQGVDREVLAVFQFLNFPIQLMAPIVVTKLIDLEIGGKHILDTYNWLIPIRLIIGTIYGLSVVALPYITPYVGSHYLMLIYFFHSLDQGLWYSQFTVDSAFFSVISDERFGSTYMTLFNTVGALAEYLSSTFFLSTRRWMDWNYCNDYAWDAKLKTWSCSGTGVIDGFQVELAIGAIVGILYINLALPLMRKLSQASASEFRVVQEEKDGSLVLAEEVEE